MSKQAMLITLFTTFTTKHYVDYRTKMYIDFFLLLFLFHAAADVRDENIIKQEESRVENFRNLTRKNSSWLKLINWFIGGTRFQWLFYETKTFLA